MHVVKIKLVAPSYDRAWILCNLAIAFVMIGHMQYLSTEYVVVMGAQYISAYSH
jgi:hypothetical protein